MNKDQDISASGSDSAQERSQSLKEGMHKTAKGNAFNSQVAQYMFWSATTLMGLAIGAPLLGGAEFSAIASTLGTTPTVLGLGMGGVSAATLAGSIYFSEEAAEQSENNDLMYSKKQALDIAKAMKRENATTPVIVALPTMPDASQAARLDGKSWAESVSANGKKSAQPAQWAEYVADRQGNQHNEITL